MVNRSTPAKKTVPITVTAERNAGKTELTRSYLARGMPYKKMERNVIFPTQSGLNIKRRLMRISKIPYECFFVRLW
jgi:hypothetical protein